MIESWVGAMSRLLPHAIGEGGHHFTFLTRNLHHYLRSAPADRPHPLLAARNVLTAETNDPETLLPYIARLHEILGFDGVLSSCDYYLPTAALVARQLNLPGPPPQAVAAACRKDLTRRVLDQAGVPGPRYAVCHDWAGTVAAAGQIGYPLVVKPVDLCAGMLVRQVANEQELARACRELSGFPVNARGQVRANVTLLEELLTGAEVSVETVSFAGATRVIGVTDKSIGGAPRFIETGHMFPAGISKRQAGQAADTALAALAALGLDQVVAHTEIKLTPGGPKVVEVNPRPAGNRITELIRHVTGIDLAAAAVHTALGLEPDLAVRATGVRSAAIAFLLPERDGVLAGIDGADDLPSQEGVLEVNLPAPGRTVRAAISNNEYLGHVMAVDPAGGPARERVEELISGVRPRYAEEVA